MYAYYIHPQMMYPETIAVEKITHLDRLEQDDLDPRPHSSSSSSTSSPSQQPQQAHHQHFDHHNNAGVGYLPHLNFSLEQQQQLTGHDDVSPQVCPYVWVHSCVCLVAYVWMHTCTYACMHVCLVEGAIPLDANLFSSFLCLTYHSCKYPQWGWYVTLTPPKPEFFNNNNSNSNKDGHRPVHHHHPRSSDLRPSMT